METILTDKERQTIKRMALYWQEVRGRDDTSTLRYEAEMIFNNLGHNRILLIVESYIKLTED